MKQMKFYGMATAFRTTIQEGQSSALTAVEMVSMLIDAKWDDRNFRRIARNNLWLQSALLQQQKTVLQA